MNQICDHDFEKYSEVENKCKKCGFLSARHYGVYSYGDLIVQDYEAGRQ